LRERIGRGGMGTVYRAEHLRLGRTVAIKVLSAACTDSGSVVSRFLRETRMLGGLRHEHLVEATDADEADGHYFLVMELLDGVDLDRLSRRIGRLRVAD